MKPSCGCFGWSAFEFFAHFYFGILYKLHGVGGNNSQLGLIIFEYTELHGDAQMIKAKLEGDKLPIPKTILQKAGLSDGDEVEVRLEEGKVVIKPIATKAQFKKELRGCVEISKIDPLEAKRIWKA